jgi:tape measure domain-containing protein
MPTSSERLAILIEANTRSYENAMKRIEQKTNQAIRSAEKPIKRLDASLKATSTTATTFARRIGVAFAAIGAAQGAQALSRAADEWITAQNKLAAASEVAGRQARSAQSLNQIAKETRSSLEGTVDLYAKLLRATKDVAQSEAEVARATEIVNKAFKAGGAAASEQAAGVLQLSQALGSGVLQGDELRSLRENAPLLAQAIADEFKTTIAGLKELGEQGELTSDRVFRAILSSAPKIEAAFGKTQSTIGDAATQVGNAFTEMVGEFDAMLGVSGRVVDRLDAIAAAMRDMTDSRVVKWIGEVVDAINKLEAAGTQLLAPAPTMARVLEDTREYREELERLRPIVNEIVMLQAVTKTPPNLVEQGTLDRFEELRLLLKDSSAELQKLAQTDLSRLGDGIGDVADELREFLPFLRQIGQAFGLLTQQVAALAAVPLAAPIGAGGAIGDFVSQVVQAESGGSATAQNPNSTATGAGQFLESTWLALFKKHFADQAAGMSDQAILALRNDMGTSRAMIEAYAEENAAVLQRAGQAVTAANLHLAHFLGGAGATAVLNAPPGTPISSIGAITPAAQAANPTILGAGATRESVLQYAAGRAGLPTEAAAADAATEAAKAAADAAEDAKQKQEELTQAKADFEKMLAREGQAIKLESDALRQSTAAAEYAAEKQRLTNELTDAGIPITEAYAAAIEDVALASAALVTAQEIDATNKQQAQEKTEAATQAAIDQADAIRGLASDVIGGLVSDLANGVKPAEALANALGKIAQKLIDIGVNALVSGLFGPQGSPLGGIFGSLLGGAGAVPTITGGLFHSGGIVGQGGPSRTVPASAFVGAPRYHSGGVAGFKPGEVPAILKRGELVVPVPTSMRPVSASRGGGGRQHVSVENTVRLEPSPLFAATVESRAQQAEDRAVRRAPGHMANLQQRRLVGSSGRG